MLHKHNDSINAEIDLLIDISFVGSSNESQYQFDYFRLIYCNPKIIFNRAPGNVNCILNAYPKDEYKNKTKVLLRSMPYKDFLLTAYWKSISDHVKETKKHCCESCGSSQNLSVHHKSYIHRGEEIFYLEDLACFCFSCHNHYHGV